MGKKKVRKQILRYGKWMDPRNPGRVLEFTRKLGEKIVENFKHTPFAPVLKGHHSLQEADSNPSLIAAKNLAKVEAHEDGVFAEFEADEEVLDKYNDVSVGLDLDYTNKETGENIGATLRHLALTTDPYIKGLKGFAALSEPNESILINLSDIQIMNKADKNTELSDEQAVETTEEQVVEETTETKVEAVETEESKVTEEVTPKVEEVAEAAPETAGQIQASDLELKIKELDDKNKSLTAELRIKTAEEKYNTLLSDGKILPVMKDVVTQLYMADNTTVNLSDGSEVSLSDKLDEFFKSMPSLVNTKAQGVNLNDNSTVNAVDVDPKVMDGLRASRKNLSDEEFASFIEKNTTLINKFVEEKGIK